MNKDILHMDDVQVTGWLRFANLIIDVICIYVIIFIIIISCQLLTLLGIMGPALWFENISDAQDRVFFAAVFFLYYFLFEAFTQRTIGKFITGTMVVNASGEEPSMPSLAGRSLLRLIGLDALSFLGNNRGWHDSAPGVYVVKTKRWKELTKLKRSFDEIGAPQEGTTVTAEI